MVEWLVTWNNGYTEFKEHFKDKYQAEQFFKEMTMEYGYNQPCIYKLVKRYTTYYTDTRRYSD